MTETRTTKLPILYRASEELEFRAEEGAGEEAIPFSISSEIEIERTNMWTGERWIEKLSHAPEAIDDTYLKRGMSLRLDTHWGPQVGIIENGRSAKKKLVGDVRFSTRPEGEWARSDVVRKIRKYVSVGYRILEQKLVETRKNGMRVYLATRWMPVHAALVPDPWDPTVGAYARSQEGAPAPELYDVVTVGEAPAEEERTMSDPTKPTTTVTADPPVSTRNRNAEITEIEDMVSGFRARGFQITEEQRRDWIQKDLTPPQVATELAKSVRTVGFNPPASESLAGSERDMSRYSYTRALRLAAGEEKWDGIEAEVHAELKRSNPGVGKGIMLPHRTRLSTRTLDSKTPGKGLELVQESPGELIEILRNRAMVRALGARVMGGLVGPIPFPKQTGDMTVQVLPENPPADAEESDLSTGLVNLTPRNFVGAGSWSKQLIMQTSYDVEGMVKESIGEAHALAVDYYSLYGDGTGGRPIGIYNAPDVQIVDFGGVPSYKKIVEMQGKVASRNALRGTLGYMTHPMMAALLKTIAEISAANSRPIWTGPLEDGEMGGYRAVATNQISDVMDDSAETGGVDHGLVYANWRDLIIGLWGDAIEVTVDTITGARRMLIKITTFQMGDTMLRHGQSFCKGHNARLA